MTSQLFRIQHDGNIERVLEGAHLVATTAYLAKAELIPSRTTPTGYEYYTCVLLDIQQQPIVDNTFDVSGIKCRLESRDVWATRRDVTTNPDALDGVDGIALACYITDRLGIERRVLCNNNRHDGGAWGTLLKYVREVVKFGTHAAMQEIRALRVALAKEERQNTELLQELCKLPLKVGQSKLESGSLTKLNGS